MTDIALRGAVASEADQLAELLLRVREQNVGAIPPAVHPLDDMRRWMREVVFGSMDVWVAEVPGRALPLIGMMVVRRPDWLEQLYVEADFSGRGLGSRLVALAKGEFPAGLQLWTFQSNVGACRFYESHGFVPVQWTDGDNEEQAPDVRYQWDPQQPPK
jgi:GNAT superfamily N-acetyltransferase